MLNALDGAYRQERFCFKGAKAMSNTLTLQRDMAASKIAAILLATGTTLACFAMFGLTRSFVFSTSGTEEPGIHPRAGIPQLEVDPTIAITPTPETQTEWTVPTATPGGTYLQPADTNSRGFNRSIPGCGTEADGIIRCWGGATPVPWALMPGDVWEDANGNHHAYSEPVGMNGSNGGFRTGNGLRKDK